MGFVVVLFLSPLCLSFSRPCITHTLVLIIPIIFHHFHVLFNALKELSWFYKRIKQVKYHYKISLTVKDLIKHDWKQSNVLGELIQKASLFQKRYQYHNSWFISRKYIHFLSYKLLVRYPKRATVAYLFQSYNSFLSITAFISNN